MKKLLLILLLFMFCANVFSQKIKSEAIFIYNFTRILSWPAENKQGDIVIQVLENIDMVDEINNYAFRKPVYGQKVIAQYTSIYDISKCHIIYIPATKTDLLPTVLSKIENENILVVTEDVDLVRNGADISFERTFNEEGEEIINYQYNEENIRKHNIKISAEFKGYGIKVEKE